MFKNIIKRDGRIVPFDPEKITIAISKAGKATGEFDYDTARRLTIKVLLLAEELIRDRDPHVEEIQDIVEEILLSSPYRKTAKAYIIYRDQHARMREIARQGGLELIDSYLSKVDWRVKENSNMSFSLQGLNNYISSEISKSYWLHKIYPPEVRDAHINGDLHIHDLNVLAPYCVGWDLMDLLIRGFGGVSGKVESGPAKHFRSALGQIVNFLFTLQGEAAGAQAFSNVDTLLAPFIAHDELNYKQIKQALQEWVFNLNVPTRVGFQTPFSNITLDLKVPEHLKGQAVIIGGKPENASYGDFQREVDLFNKALFEVLTEGDAKGRVFTFPIPTINITKDFDWQSPVVDLIMEATAKYGIPYFANYVNSDLNPEDARSMCLAPEEEIIFKNSGKIKRTCIKELAESYKVDDFDDEGWAECNSESNLQVLSLNPQTFKLEWTNVKRFLKIKTDKALEITTEDGKKTIFSPTHPVAVYTSDGLKMKFARDLSKEDFLLTLKTAEEVLQREYQKIEDMVLDEDLAKILGYFTAEGNYLFESRKGYTHYGEPKGMQFTFRGDDFENIDLMRTLIEKLFKRKPKEKKDPRYNVLYLYVYDSKISRIFYQAGFRKYGRLPQIIFNSPISVINEFLEFFIKGDGYIKRKEIHLNDLELSRDLALLLTLTGKPITYRIRKNSQRIYIQHAKSGQKKKNGLLNNPILSERLPGWLALSTTKVPGLNKKRTVGLNTLDKYSAHTEESSRIKNSHIYLTRIKEIKLIEYEKPREFYDLELEKNHLFVHSLGNISFNCCRLRLETRELKHRGGGLFGSNPLTGSIGVVTLNLPRIGYLSKSEEEFFTYLTRLMDIAKTSLEIKRKVLERFTDAGLYPYSKHYLSSVKERTGAYWCNHFSTIGIIGMNEAIANARWLSSKGIWTEEGKAFALKVMDFMREKLMEYQKETGNLYNLEATPAEGTSYRLAKIDKQKYPDIITQGRENPYYTNSTWLPVNFTESITYILDHQDELQSKYTGGTVIHLFLGEQPESERLKNFIKAVFEKYRLPYISITPTFSICPECGYIEGEHQSCPKCGRTTEVYSRVVGYLRPVDNWNEGKKEEFKDRKYLQMKN